ncbi:hypothetical protein [Crateriforma conspicua]|uniref:hypothetical protein n=1 Tax=Crateriforma conspicua TaxID=2527996 RepID=UPI00118A32D3|nr:hypothetical protein [Crateriforma conspicua]QDV64657.1 hypothetical protein Mal65_38180 [Crateriforma conspicua]
MLRSGATKIRRRRVAASCTGILIGAWLVVSTVPMVVALPTASAQEATADRSDGPSSPAKDIRDGSPRIDISDYPEPPESLRSWIRSGNVSFYRGGTSFDGETIFKTDLNFRSQCRWRKQREQNRQVIRIDYRLTRLRVSLAHHIHLKRIPPKDRFWDSALVQHEFDHVRISTLVAKSKHLADDLKAASPILRELPSGQRVTQAWVDQVVREHVQHRFHQMNELIQIRYDDLDQQTAHGRRPIPADSQVRQWLGEPAKASTEH